MHILVIEDEPKVVQAIMQGLESENYRVTAAVTGEEGYFLATTQAFDLILLDLMLPGRDGLDILSALRRQGCQTPVLILTARDAIEDRVTGLDAGADDYLVKPFAFPELSARIRALTRRQDWQLQTWVVSGREQTDFCQIARRLAQILQRRLLVAPIPASLFRAMSSTTRIIGLKSLAQRFYGFQIPKTWHTAEIWDLLPGETTPLQVGLQQTVIQYQNSFQ